MHDPQHIQDEIVDSFSLFSEWLDRYQYLIDLGRKLPPLDDAEKTDDKLLAGCQSQVWLLLEGDTGEVTIRANSDRTTDRRHRALFYQENRAQRAPVPDPRQRPPRHAGRHQKPRPGFAHTFVRARLRAIFPELRPQGGSYTTARRLTGAVLTPSVPGRRDTALRWAVHPAWPGRFPHRSLHNSHTHLHPGSSGPCQFY